MRTLKSVLETGAESGVFWLMSPAPKEEISQQAAKIDAAYFHIEGKKLHSKTQFLNHVATALSFPDYFDNNWDALEDCLTDFSWHDANGYIILFDDADQLHQYAAHDFDTVLEIFRAATNYWQEQKKQFLVLLRGKPVGTIEQLG